MTRLEPAINDGLHKLDGKLVDYAAVLNHTQRDQFAHTDLDLLVLLACDNDALKKSNYARLFAFVADMRRCLRSDFYGFTSFRHQTFYTAELRKLNISATPFHLLVYPNSYHFCLWETHSRVLTMLKTGHVILQRKDFVFRESDRPRDPYEPHPFLQLLYEAYLFYACSNIQSSTIKWDTVKKLEYAVKNLTLEALLKDGGVVNDFSSSWSYVLRHLATIHAHGVDCRIVKKIWSMRKAGYKSSSQQEILRAFKSAFEYYDDVVRALF